MEDGILTRYDHLVPKDQLVVDYMILTLCQKDKEIRQVTDQVKDVLDKLNPEGDEK